MSIAAAGGFDEAGDGTLYADPVILDAVEELGLLEEVDSELDVPSKERLSRYQQTLLNQFFNCTGSDVPHKIDVRSWPQAHGLKPQFVKNTGGFAPPEHRLRMLKFADGRTVYESWTAVPKPVENIADAANGHLPIGEWMLTYHVYDAHWCDCPQAKLSMVEWTDGSVHAMHPDCGRERKSRVEGDMRSHVASLHLAPEDDATYNGHYPTLRGNSIAHHDPSKAGMQAYQGGEIIRSRDGVPIRGGHEITGGRAEWKNRTKGYVEMDGGYWKDVDRYKGEFKAARDEKSKLNEEVADKRLPRKLGEL